MSGTVTLVARTAIDRRIGADAVVPDHLAALSSAEIAALPVWIGRERAALGDFFDVRGERADELRIEGDGLASVDGLGSGMTGGRLLVDGDAGHGVGTGMSDGVIEVRGRAGHGAGAGMSGGVLRISGDAGDRLAGALPGGRGMSGGEVIVGGSAGCDAGASCRRGLIAVGGSVGGGAARQMIAGSLIVAGRVTGSGAGAFLKRGTIVCMGGLEVPETFRYACTFRPPHLRMTLVYLHRQYGWPLNPQLTGGRYRRYCGDLLDPGKGEILVWEGA